ncbi:RHS repeat protein [Photorhabdus luminescens]|uniref:RHS repeat protein n=1 Tax=Photorhabdus luminescens TaxID=29488 RepID=UPI00224001CE|nr:RHS repeat domain-containing protein [Photorhabdus luminescens]MCW7762309.1 RHS repeat protein [Photorhabdus luminescens subsp. venezuelensis]
MSSYHSAIDQKTPSINVLDNRKLNVRSLEYLRTQVDENIDELITFYEFNIQGFQVKNTDPRKNKNQSGPNFIRVFNLAGQVLREEGIDAGRTITLNDIEGRTVLTINATGVRQNHLYEDNTLPGRLLAITEQAQTEEKTTERLIWAGNTQQEKDYNLAGQCVRYYDTAGLTQLNSLSLAGVVLSQSQQLLVDNQNADWTGEDQSLWQQKLSSDVYTTQNSTDATGALLIQTDAKGNIQRLAYDVAGQLKGCWLTLKGQAEQVIIKSLTYSAAGQKLREEHGNGVITEYSYEPETQRLIGITTRRPSDAKVLQDLRYQYDPVGNVINIRNDAEATRFWRNQKVVPENNYTYDSLYQLISATGREMANIGQQNNQLPSPALPSDNNTYTNYTRGYSYDRSGNLTQIRHSSPATQNNYTTAITISNHSNRGVLSTLTTDPNQVDTLFDAGGHQTSLLPGQTLVWTSRGELKQVNNGPGNEWYRYGSNGMRQLKVSEQQTQNTTQQQRVIYLPGLELRTTQNSATTTEELHVITLGEAGRAQVRVLHWESGKPEGIDNNQLRYSYDNLIGSSQLELDNQGQIISEEEYYPFGGTALWAANSQVEAGYKTIRYSGKERDASGLYYYGYRYYQPWAGRWLSADPAGTVDGLNLYRMVRNNPVSLQDENGLAPERGKYTKEVNFLDELKFKLAARNSHVVKWNEKESSYTKNKSLKVVRVGDSDPSGYLLSHEELLKGIEQSQIIYSRLEENPSLSEKSKTNLSLGSEISDYMAKTIKDTISEYAEGHKYRSNHPDFYAETDFFALMDKREKNDYSGERKIYAAMEVKVYHDLKNKQSELHVNYALAHPYTQLSNEERAQLQEAEPAIAINREYNFKGVGKFLTMKAIKKSLKGQKINRISTDAINVRSAAIAENLGMRRAS